jgi:hypothetical protein
MRLQAKRLWLSVAQVCAALIAMISFFTWAPWLTAMTRDEALAAYDQPVPESWQAVIMGHGTLTRWRLGTIDENPWGFAACTLVLIGCVIFLLFSVRFGLQGRFQWTRPRR